MIIANNYSFYSWGGAGNSYAADDSLIYWSDDFDKEIGKPLGKATKDGYAYHRDFEHCTVDVNLETKTSSIVWKSVDRKTHTVKGEDQRMSHTEECRPFLKKHVTFTKH